MSSINDINWEEVLAGLDYMENDAVFSIPGLGAIKRVTRRFQQDAEISAIMTDQFIRNNEESMRQEVLDAAVNTATAPSTHTHIERTVYRNGSAFNVSVTKWGDYMVESKGLRSTSPDLSMAMRYATDRLCVKCRNIKGLFVGRISD